jgi:hypothetical protein
VTLHEIRDRTGVGGTGKVSLTFAQEVLAKQHRGQWLERFCRSMLCVVTLDRGGGSLFLGKRVVV